jgi:hypothetical protein
MILCPVCSHPVPGLRNKLLTPKDDVIEQMLGCGTCHAVVRVEIRLLRGTDLSAEDLDKRMNRSSKGDGGRYG